MKPQDMLDAEKWQDLCNRQSEREALALAEGAAAFRRQVEKAAQEGSATRTPVARKMLESGIEPLELAIQAWLDNPAPAANSLRQEGYLADVRSKRGPKPVAAKWIKAVGVQVAAYMTLKVVLDGIVKRREYTTICCEVSDLLLDELRYRRLREQAPGLFQYKLQSFHTSSYTHMARSMDHAVRTARSDEHDQPIDVSDLHLTPHQRVNVGGILVGLLSMVGLADGAPLIEERIERRVRGGILKTVRYLEATTETSKWLEDREDHLARQFFQTQQVPMIAPPLPWKQGQRGGFLFALLRKFPMVRWVRDAAHRDRAEHADTPLVFQTLNALQSTAWRVNESVMLLIREIERRGGGIAGIPKVDPNPLPNRPQDISTNEAARKVWRRAAAIVKDQNHFRKLRAREARRVIDTAGVVVNEEAIFFPYSLDFRGRIYPVADYLHPQGGDLARGLLTFAQGKALDADGARWLAIHGANCLDEVPEGKMARMTFEERVAWIHSHTQEIIQVADDPFVNLWWEKAESPLQFFAFCIEWRNLIRANGRGEEYVCSLPVSMDGSCNGLQHFAALLRDEVGGSAVNVVPQDRPQDIYQRVADAVLDKLEDEAVNDPLAARVLGLQLVTRKLAKRPTMTFGYGSKQYGFGQQIREYLRGLDNWHEIKERLGTKPNAKGKEVSQVGAACRLLARLIWESLEDTVVKAFEGMQWLQQAARGIVAGSKLVEWTVPVTQFHVRQEYVEWQRQRVFTILAGKILHSRLNIPSTKLDARKQANAVSPNLIHSLDAAALMLTVSQAATDGVESFAMVHDSYGTLPADCSVLVRCCRQSFVRLYTMEDVVSSLHQQFAAQYADPTECPEPPTKGTLDVNAVLASDYFFA